MKITSIKYVPIDYTRSSKIAVDAIFWCELFKIRFLYNQRHTVPVSNIIMFVSVFSNFKMSDKFTKKLNTTRLDCTLLHTKYLIVIRIYLKFKTKISLRLCSDNFQDI